MTLEVFQLYVVGDQTFVSNDLCLWPTLPQSTNSGITVNLLIKKGFRFQPMTFRSCSDLDMDEIFRVYVTHKMIQGHGNEQAFPFLQERRSMWISVIPT